MSMRKARALCAALATTCLLSVAGPASAAIMLLTHTGVVGQTSDSAEAPPGSRFKIEIRYDNSKGLTREDVSPGVDTLSLLSFQGVNPILSLTVTMEGHAPHVATDLGLGFIQQSISVQDDEIGPHRYRFYGFEIWSKTPSNVPLVRINSYLTGAYLPMDFGVPFESGTFDEGLVNLPGLVFLVDNTIFPTGHVRAERLPVSSPTPEPAAWALMIIGFGVSGGMLRRRALAAV